MNGAGKSDRPIVLRQTMQTMRERLQAKLGQVKTELRRRLHDPVPEVGSWLRSVVGGHLRYYGVPTNSRALRLFRLRVGRPRTRTRAHRRLHQRRSYRWGPPWVANPSTYDSFIHNTLPVFTGAQEVKMILKEP